MTAGTDFYISGPEALASETVVANYRQRLWTQVRFGPILSKRF
jgi:hypothetical protein